MPKKDAEARGTFSDGAASRPASVYHRYRYLARVLDRMLRAQEEKVRTAQAALDAELAEDERALIAAVRQLREHGHLDEDPPDVSPG